MFCRGSWDFAVFRIWGDFGVFSFIQSDEGEVFSRAEKRGLHEYISRAGKTWNLATSICTCVFSFVRFERRISCAVIVLLAPVGVRVTWKKHESLGIREHYTCFTIAEARVCRDIGLFPSCVFLKQLTLTTVEI